MAGALGSSIPVKTINLHVGWITYSQPETWGSTFLRLDFRVRALFQLVHFNWKNPGAAHLEKHCSLHPFPVSLCSVRTGLLRNLFCSIMTSCHSSTALEGKCKRRQRLKQLKNPVSSSLTVEVAMCHSSPNSVADGQEDVVWLPLVWATSQSAFWCNSPNICRVSTALTGGGLVNRALGHCLAVPPRMMQNPALCTTTLFCSSIYKGKWHCFCSVAVAEVIHRPGAGPMLFVLLHRL